jgi:hypothetical protein
MALDLCIQFRDLSTRRNIEQTPLLVDIKDPSRSIIFYACIIYPCDDICFIAAMRISWGDGVSRPGPTRT